MEPVTELVVPFISKSTLVHLNTADNIPYEYMTKSHGIQLGLSTVDLDKPIIYMVTSGTFGLLEEDGSDYVVPFKFKQSFKMKATIKSAKKLIFKPVID